jgi:hypothetical protein
MERLRFRRHWGKVCDALRAVRLIRDATFLLAANLAYELLSLIAACRETEPAPASVQSPRFVAEG